MLSSTSGINGFSDASSDRGIDWGMGGDYWGYRNGGLNETFGGGGDALESNPAYQQYLANLAQNYTRNAWNNDHNISWAEQQAINGITGQNYSAEYYQNQAAYFQAERDFVNAANAQANTIGDLQRRNAFLNAMQQFVNSGMADMTAYNQANQILAQSSQNSGATTGADSSWAGSENPTFIGGNPYWFVNITGSQSPIIMDAITSRSSIINASYSDNISLTPITGLGYNQDIHQQSRDFIKSLPLDVNYSLNREEIQKWVDAVNIYLDENPTAERFLNGLLGQLKIDTGLEIPPDGIRGILSIFAEVGSLKTFISSSQERSSSTPLPGSFGQENWGVELKAYSKILVRVGDNFSRIFADISFERTISIFLHELVHAWGKRDGSSLFSDDAAAKALNKLGFAVSADEFRNDSRMASVFRETQGSYVGSYLFGYVGDYFMGVSNDNMIGLTLITQHNSRLRRCRTILSADLYIEQAAAAHRLLFRVLFQMLRRLQTTVTE